MIKIASVIFGLTAIIGFTLGVAFGYSRAAESNLLIRQNAHDKEIELLNNCLIHTDRNAVECMSIAKSYFSVPKRELTPEEMYIQIDDSEF